MNNRDILPHIFGFINKYDRNICRVSRFWDEMYIKATKIYGIEIKFIEKISSEKFIELCSLPRFSSTYESVKKNRNSFFKHK